MKAVADTLGVSRSNLIERLKGRSKPRGPYNKAEDAELLPAIRRLVDQRPTYGYRRIAALLNRERRAADQPVVNAKRIHRIMGTRCDQPVLSLHDAFRGHSDGFFQDVFHVCGAERTDGIIAAGDIELISSVRVAFFSV